MSIPYFEQFLSSTLHELVQKREFETKLGEEIQLIEEPITIEALKNNPAKFILIGIPEDIGVKANFGIGGTHTAWPAFLKAFLNMQSNNVLNAKNCILLGAFNFDSFKSKNPEPTQIDYTDWVMQIDEYVIPLIELIVEAGKIPIIIGGGHNNAYPIVCGTSRALVKTKKLEFAIINCINLDAHTDLRSDERRHSGNAFRFGLSEGFIGKYGVLGYHRNYLNHGIERYIQRSEDRIKVISYEDIFIDKLLSFDDASKSLFEFCSDKPIGIELDLDCIEDTLSSAKTPNGISALTARQWISNSSKHKPVYLHICEGVATRADGETQPSIGKLIAYLVSDFLISYPI